MAKLQLYVQQVNLALEETSQQVLASMPCIMADAQVSFHIYYSPFRLKSDIHELFSLFPKNRASKQRRAN